MVNTKCKACGAESYGYDLCVACWNEYKNDTLKVVHTRRGWKKLEEGEYAEPDGFTYSVKAQLETITERAYKGIIAQALPAEFQLHSQVGLSSILEKIPHGDEKCLRVGELNRTVDFLVTDREEAPVLIIEINDSSHNEPGRLSRDIKLERMCQDAGIRLREIYLSKHESEAVIRDRIRQDLSSPKPERIPWNHKIIKPEPIPEKPPLEHTTKRRKHSIAMLLCMFMGFLGAHCVYAARLESAALFWVFDTLLILTFAHALPIWIGIVSLTVLIFLWGSDMVKLNAGRYIDGYGRLINPYL